MRDRQNPGLYAAFHFANEINPEPLQWLWPNRIPLAKLTLLIGDPGAGKSLLAADLAARVSAALPWPDQPLPPKPEPRTLNPTYPAGVLFVAPEDCPHDTLIPRLSAAGANLDNICILEGATDSPSCLHAFRPSCLPPGAQALASSAARPTREPTVLPLTLPDHADILQEAIRAIDHPGLVILDPLHALLSPAAQAGSDALTETLAALAETARSYNVAILAVGHLVKARSHRMLYRVRGSLSLVAAARAVQFLSFHHDHPDRRVLSPLKTVYGPPPAPLTFRITPQSSLEWESSAGPTRPGSPDSKCNVPPDLFGMSPDAHSALSDACDWLSDHLAAGPRPVPEILRRARAAGHSMRTLRRAKRILAVRSLKPSDESTWYWRQQNLSDNQGVQLARVAQFG
jgi:hypothetical protein